MECLSLSMRPAGFIVGQSVRLSASGGKEEGKRREHTQPDSSAPFLFVTLVVLAQFSSSPLLTHITAPSSRGHVVHLLSPIRKLRGVGGILRLGTYLELRVLDKQGRRTGRCLLHHPTPAKRRLLLTLQQTTMVSHRLR